jgi:L-ascorbate metabolism protein UlaG (beta-lactamase superfamily)
MIEPIQSDDRLLADIHAMLSDTQQAHLWWLGQSGFLLQCQGRHLLFDPYLSDSLTEKYAQTDKPHVRMTRRVIEPERLNFVDVVTSTHNHTDHLDAATLVPLFQANPALKLVLPAANLHFAASRLGVSAERFVTVDDGESVTASGFTIHAVPAAHEAIERDEMGRCRFLGYVVKCDGLTVYHSGDTVRFEGMEDRLREFKIDVALLPINGRRPERRVTGNLWGREAAELAHESGVGLVVPCHYEMFAFNTETTEEFVATCQKLGQRFHILRAGERLSLGI